MTVEDLKALLLVGTETRHLDYKEQFNWASIDQDEKVKLVKDILAMANTHNGGNIVFGVRDSDYQPVGMSNDDFESFDQTKTNDFLHRYTDPRFSCQVYKFQTERRKHVVVEVREFAEIPIICKLNAHSSKGGKSILKQGTLYIRTEKATSEAVSNSDEMREVLEMAMVKKETNFLATIQAMMNRPSGQASAPELPSGEPVKASLIPNLTFEKRG